MRRLHTRQDDERRGGFTLIELMIAVAIIGILSATAITSWRFYQYRSKRTEAMTNLEAVSKMETSYFGVYGVYYGAAPMPPPPPSPAKRIWDAASQAEYAGLGYAPEGAVVYSYDVNDFPGDCACPVLPGGATCFAASATGDVDGDGSIAVIAYFQPDADGNTCVTAIGANPPPLRGANPILGEPILIPVGPGSDDF